MPRFLHFSVREAATTLVFGVACAACASAAEGEELAGTQSDVISNDFTEPTLDAAERAAALKAFAHVDPQGIAPADLLGDAILFAQANKSKLKKPDIVSVIDFARHSGEKRLFIVNLESGAVKAYEVAHGEGSDPSNTGTPTEFSNTNNSHMSSLGFYVTAETYQGKNGRSLRLDGMSTTNSNARSRAIVVHGADYVSEKSAKQGRSWGCPAVSQAVRDEVIDAVQEGSVLFIGRSNGASKGDTLPPFGQSPSVEDGKDPETCVPMTAQEACDKAFSTQQVECGRVSDGCGGAVSCDGLPSFGCMSTQECRSNRCVTTVCVPESATVLCKAAKQARGVECGRIADNCTGEVNCSTLAAFECGTGKTCSANKCVDDLSADEDEKDTDEVEPKPKPEPEDSSKTVSPGGDDGDGDPSADTKDKPAAKKKAVSGGCSAVGGSSSSSSGILLSALVAATVLARRRRMAKDETTIVDG